MNRIVNTNTVCPCDKAARLGQNVDIVASQLLANALESEIQDSQEAIKGIQQGLDDFEAGRYRSFDENNNW